MTHSFVIQEKLAFLHITLDDKTLNKMFYFNIDEAIIGID